MTLEQILSEHYNREIIEVRHDYDGEVYFKYNNDT